MASKTKQPPKTGLRNRKVQGFAALLVVAAVASGAVAWSLSGSDDKPGSATSDPSAPPKTPGDKYQADVLQDFASMSTTLVSYLQTLQNWRKDKVDDQQVAGVAQNMLDDITDTQHALAARGPFEQAPRAIVDYQLAAAGYGQSAALAKITAGVPRGPLRTQLQLAISRVQTISDRVFDQAQAELKPYMTPDRDIPGVIIRKAPEVPNWAAGAYAPGAPLTDVKGDKTQREYQDTRPEQSFTAWSKLVRDAGLPSAKDEATAISDGAMPALRTQAVDFTKTCDLLYGKPDPKGERLVSTRLQLALLIDAEAAQAGQAAALSPQKNHDALLTVAKTLAVIGDKMWDPRLGERNTGFPDSLLTTLPTATPAPTP